MLYLLILRPQQVGEMEWQESYEVQQREVQSPPVPGEEQTQCQDIFGAVWLGQSKERGRLFSLVPSGGTRGLENKWKYGKSPLAWNFFTVRVVKHREKLHTDIVVSPSLELLKPNWTQLWALADHGLMGMWCKMISEGIFQLQQFLWKLEWFDPMLLFWTDCSALMGSLIPLSLCSHLLNYPCFWVGFLVL